jgi:ABC-type transporter lipoprotein component MlaA
MKNSVDPIRWFNSNGTSFVKQINDIIFKPPGHAYQYNKLYYDDKGDIYKITN